MNIIIETPSLARIENATDQEISILREQFQYDDGKVKEQLRRHRNNRWWRKKNPDTWEEKEIELSIQVKKNVVTQSGGKVYIKPGSIPYIKNVDFTIKKDIEYPELKPIKWVVEPEFEPYKYQADSVSELLKINHGNVSLPTGCGKSFILLMLAQQIGEGVVVVTPSKSIFKELLEEFQLRLGKKNVGGYGDGKKDIKKPITIAIGRSITLLKEGTEQYEFFANKKALLVDESHTWGADGLEKVCHGVLANAPRRFFMSATQTRGDGTVKVLQSIIGQTVVEMTILEAIRDGFLCPLKFHVKTLYSPSNLRKKDPLECKREHFLYNKEIARFYSNIANAMWKVHNESTLILVEELRQIQMLTELLTVPFAYIHSGSKKDAAQWGLEKVSLSDELDRFNRGEVKVLIGTKSISTGTNIYPTHNVCNWVGGSSEIVTKQGTMGRSTRWMKKKFQEFHKEKTHSKIWDVDVIKQVILQNQLKRRLSYYQETGEEINFIK